MLRVHAVTHGARAGHCYILADACDVGPGSKVVEYSHCVRELVPVYMRGVRTTRYEKLRQLVLKLRSSTTAGMRSFA